MINLIRLLLVFLAMLLVVGCSTTATGPIFQYEQNNPESEVANIYIYRSNVADGMDSYEAVFSIDNEEAIRLRMNGYGVVSLAPEDYLFSLTWDLIGGVIFREIDSAELLAQIEAGEDYFIKVNTQAGYSRVRWSIDLVDKKTALIELKDLKREQLSKQFIAEPL